MRFIIALFLLALVSGCSTLFGVRAEQPRYETIPPKGVDAAQATLDRESCRAFGYSADKIYLACMEKMGYEIHATQNGNTYLVKFADIIWE